MLGVITRVTPFLIRHGVRVVKSVLYLFSAYEFGKFFTKKASSDFMYTVSNNLYIKGAIGLFILVVLLKALGGSRLKRNSGVSAIVFFTFMAFLPLAYFGLKKSKSELLRDKYIVVEQLLGKGQIGKGDILLQLTPKSFNEKARAKVITTAIRRHKNKIAESLINDMPVSMLKRNSFLATAIVARNTTIVSLILSKKSFDLQGKEVYHPLYFLGLNYRNSWHTPLEIALKQENKEIARAIYEELKRRGKWDDKSMETLENIEILNN